MADASKAPVSRGCLGLEHRSGVVAQQQIGMTDDSGADCTRAVAAACAHRRGIIGEFHLADRAQSFRPVGAVHGAAIDIRGPDAVMAGDDVGGDLLALAGAIRPEVIMAGDDRARRQEVPQSTFTYIDVMAIENEAGAVAEPKVLDAIKITHFFMQLLHDFLSMSAHRNMIVPMRFGFLA